MSDADRTLRGIYDEMAGDYAASWGDLLDRSPLDGELVDRVADLATAGGPILDLGCGPGQATRRISDRGRQAIGLDFATAMLRAGRHRAPDLPFVAADIRRLPVRDTGAGGAVALYVLQHVPREELTPTFTELSHVLAPGAPLLLGTHAGTGDYLVERSPLANTLHDADELTAALEASSFRIVDVRHRDPIEREFDARRVYVLATRGR